MRTPHRAPSLRRLARALALGASASALASVSAHAAPPRGAGGPAEGAAPAILAVSATVADAEAPVACAGGHVLVQLRDGATPSSDALAAAGVVALSSPFVEPPANAAVARATGLDRWRRAQLAHGTDPHAAVRALARLGGIARAEVDAEGGLADLPNDPDFFIQYALRNTGQSVAGSAGLAGADIGAVAAWDVTHGDPNLVIAVLDSGITPHPELAGRILPGVNVPDGTTVTLDECNHGTHVAGILAAAGDNGAGIAGVTWNAKLLPVVVVNGCSGFEADVASGLTWAVDQGARLVNMSLQFYAGNAFFLDAVRYAHAQGALMFAATGNNGSTNIAAPARWNETVAVAATNNRDERWASSNYGAETDVSAPGVSVWSLSSGGGYTYKTGTSMATPHACGAAALLWSHAPSLSRDEVRGYLEAGAKDLGAAGTDVFFGKGRIDVAASLALVPPAFAPEDLNRDGVVNAQDLAILLGAWGPCGDCDGGCAADLDGDCEVGATDLARVLSAW